ncbi:MAG: hypothetical protein ACXW1W_06540 [Methylococcaceae bacterium]
MADERAPYPYKLQGFYRIPTIKRFSFITISVALHEAPAVTLNAAYFMPDQA